MTPPDISQELASAVGARAGTISLIGYSQNWVYAFTHFDGTERILRLTADTHRSHEEIEDELDWVRFLSEQSVGVCGPIEHRDGEWMRSVRGADGVYHAVVFEKAAGRPLEEGDLGDPLYFEHGRQLGLLHALGKRKKEALPHGLLSRRKSWEAERYFTRDIGDHLPVEMQDAVRRHFLTLQGEVAAWSLLPATFGPVHFDLGYSNFFVDDGRLQVFDFDNCVNGPLVGDLAAALYGSIFTRLRRGSAGDRSAFESPKSGQNLQRVYGPFREGYRSANGWVEDWEEQLPVWFEVMFMRAVMHAIRLHDAGGDSRVRAALEEDLKMMLARTPPWSFDFREGRALD
jgi:Ser/Thr protein kinase RdoA (MazF antagonist)